MSEETQLPQAAVIMTHEVANWDTWKAVFDGHEEARKAAGILGHHINRHADNPNRVSVYMSVSDVAKAQAFSQSADLHAAMSTAGITSAPTAVWVKPLDVNLIWDRELPAMMVSHKVANLDAWFEGYTSAATLRAQGGIVGEAANQVLDDTGTVLVYHQAESQDALRAFMANPALKDVMQKAGVTSAPQVTFVTGGWSKRY